MLLDVTLKRDFGIRNRWQPEEEEEEEEELDNKTKHMKHQRQEEQREREREIDNIEASAYRAEPEKGAI